MTEFLFKYVLTPVAVVAILLGLIIIVVFPFCFGDDDGWDDDAHKGE
jgi:uncharacterized membrane protein